MNLESISQEFVRDKIYLNNASVSLMPISSINAMKEFLMEYGKMGPDSRESEHLIKELWIKTRKTISKLIRCQPNEVVLTQSVTDGVNIVANGLSFDSNSNIVIRGMTMNITQIIFHGYGWQKNSMLGVYKLIKMESSLSPT